MDMVNDSIEEDSNIITGDEDLNTTCDEDLNTTCDEGSNTTCEEDLFGVENTLPLSWKNI